MREIKFRAWDKVANDLHDWDFLRHLGLYVTELFNDEDYILMQYTGLKDKKGYEIYEGDLFEYITPISHCKYRKSVQYEESEGCWILWDGNPDNEQSRLASGLASHGEVVGNIFQSPELLKR